MDPENGIPRVRCVGKTPGKMEQSHFLKPVCKLGKDPEASRKPGPSFPHTSDLPVDQYCAEKADVP